MERDRRVAVVTDTGTSIRPDSPEARDLGVTIVPLNIQLWEGGKYVTYSDSDVNPSDFYQNMRSSEELPQTSGNIAGPLIDTFRNLREEAGSIISIHVTSEHSATWGSAMLAGNRVQGEDGPKVTIEVIDSKQVSLSEWFPVKVAAELSRNGVSLTGIKDEVEEVIKKTQIFVALETFENLKRGGRGRDILKAVIASTLKIYPVIGLEDGKLKNLAFTRSAQKAREKIIEMVGDSGKIVRLAVVHTNAPDLAEKIKEALGKVYSGDIPVYEAGPVLGVHAGEGAVGVARQIA